MIAHKHGLPTSCWVNLKGNLLSMSDYEVRGAGGPVTQEKRHDTVSP